MFFLLPLLFSFSFNITVRVILSRSKSGSVTFVLGSLQWLPVSFRVNHYYAPQTYSDLALPPLLLFCELIFCCSSPCLLNLPATLASLLFFEHTRHLPTLGALHLLEYSSLLSVESLLKSCPLRKDFPGHPV